MKHVQNQNLTIRLDAETIRKAKVLAARRGTSVSSLLSEQIQALAAREDLFERSERQAIALLSRPLALGGKPMRRGELHER